MNYKNDKRISFKAKGILSVAGSGVSKFLDIVGKSKDCRDAVRTGISELIKHGYCEKIVIL